MVSSSARDLAAQKKHKSKLTRKLLIAANVFVLLMFVSHPLVITADYYNITETKLYWFAICLVAILMVYAALYVDERIRGYKPEYNVKQIIKSIRSYEWALIAYWVLMIVSALLSPYPEKAWGRSSDVGRSESFMVQTAYIGTFFIVSRVYRPKKRDLLIFCSVAAVVATYAICQFYGFDFLGINPIGYENLLGANLVLVSTMSNINIASTYFTMALFIAIVYYVQTETKERFIYLFLSAVLIANIFVFNVESGLVGIVLTGIMMFPFVVKSNKMLTRIFIILALASAAVWLQSIFYQKMFPVNADAFRPEAEPFVGLSPYFKYISAGFFVVAIACRFVPLQKVPTKVWRISWAVVLVVAIVGILLLIPVLAERTQNGLLIEAAEVLRGELSDEAGSYRGLIWKLSVTLIGERPILGFGPDTYATVFTERFDNIVLEIMGVHVDKAHNEYLQNLINFGVLGMTALIAFFVLVFLALRKHYDDIMVVAVATAMVCYCFQAFFNFSTAIAHPIVWTMWGILGALVYHSGKEDEKAIE